jgi:hypothetical protein
MTFTTAETAAIMQALAEITIDGPTGAAHYLFTETGESVNDNWLVKLIRKIEKLNESETN